MRNQTTLDITAEDVYGINNHSSCCWAEAARVLTSHLLRCILLSKHFFFHVRGQSMLVNTTSAQSSQPKADFVVTCLQFSLIGCWWKLWFAGQRGRGGLPQVRSFSCPWRSVKCNAFFPPDRSANEWNIGQDKHYLRKPSVGFFFWEVCHPLPMGPLASHPCLLTPSPFPTSSSSSWNSSSANSSPKVPCDSLFARILSQCNEGALVQHNGLVIQLDAFFESQGSPTCCCGGR